MERVLPRQHFGTALDIVEGGREGRRALSKETLSGDTCTPHNFWLYPLIPERKRINRRVMIFIVSYVLLKLLILFQFCVKQFSYNFEFRSPVQLSSFGIITSVRVLVCCNRLLFTISFCFQSFFINIF